MNVLDEILATTLPVAQLKQTSPNVVSKAARAERLKGVLWVWNPAAVKFRPLKVASDVVLQNKEVGALRVRSETKCVTRYVRVLSSVDGDAVAKVTPVSAPHSLK